MDIDLHKDEVIIYLQREDIRRLRRKKKLNREESIYDGKEAGTLKLISLHYNGGPVVNNRVETFDDTLDALEEVDQLLWQLESGDNFEDIKYDFDWKKVMRTYEHYDNIRQQYE
jgi:hypothetical protein